MNTSDVRTLYTYNQWANHRILDACRPLDPTALTRNLGNSFGSIRDTLAHIMWAEWLWLERWQHRSPKNRSFPEALPDIAAIERRWEEIDSGQQKFLEGLNDHLLDERIAYENFRDERWEYSLAQMMQHLMNHSTYHRGQIVTLLRQLGSKAISTDYLLYFDELKAD
jgi:uncharacterized damage-inducible protein DinB